MVLYNCCEARARGPGDQTAAADAGLGLPSTARSCALSGDHAGKQTLLYLLAWDTPFLRGRCGQATGTRPFGQVIQQTHNPPRELEGLRPQHDAGVKCGDK